MANGKNGVHVHLPSRIFKFFGTLLLIVVLLALALVIFLTVTEFKPEDTETVSLTGETSAALSADKPLTVMTWNIGYGALGDNADFFMDGGKMVDTATPERVEANLRGMREVILEQNPDLLLLQEADRSSKRSHHIDECEFFAGSLPRSEWAFANNFKVAFLPYPIPPIGKVDSGIATFSKFSSQEAERVSLPNPFSWPMRMANLKRCLLINRIPIEGSDKKLILINLHLEAYDSGEGKIAQTKMLREILEQESQGGNYVIAGGDFNQIFSNADLTAYPAQEGKWQPGIIDVSEFDPKWQFLMDSGTPSCRSLDQPLAGADTRNFQFYLIDGFLVSDNISVQSLETLDLGFVYTDHNPVLLRCTLKKD